MSPLPQARTSTQLAERIAKAQNERFQLAASQRLAIPKGAAWVLGCNSSPREHVGLIFGEGCDPNREMTIHGGMWFSSYHDIDQPFLGGREQLLCDTCLLRDKIRTVLKVVIVRPKNTDLGTCFQIPAYWRERFLRLVSATDMAKLIGEEPPFESKEPAKPEQMKAVKP